MKNDTQTKDNLLYRYHCDHYYRLQAYEADTSFDTMYLPESRVKCIECLCGMTFIFYVNFTICNMT